MTAQYSGILVADDGTTTWPLTVAGTATIFDEPPFATLSGASNTALATYRNRLLLLDPGGTSESFSQFFIPLNAVVPFPIGTQLKFIQTTAGIQAINGVSGVTVTTSKSLQMLGIGARAIAQKIATDSWILFGDLQPPTSGITLWNDTLAFGTQVDGGIRGDTTGFWYAALGVINAQVLNKTRFVISKFSGAAQGYNIRSITTNTAIDGQVAFTPAAAFINTPAYAVVANDIGRVMLIVVVYDQPLDLLRLYVNNAQVGAGTSTAGQTYVPAPAQRMVIGRRSDVGSSSPTDWTICAAAGGDGFVPTNAEVLDLFTRVKATGDIQPIPAKTTRLWSHRRLGVRFQPTYWTDRQNLTAPNNVGMPGVAALNNAGTGTSPGDLGFVEIVNPVFSY